MSGCVWELPGYNFLSEPQTVAVSMGPLRWNVQQVLCSLNPQGSEMKFGWDDRWPDSLVFGLGMCIYCKFVHISFASSAKGFLGGSPPSLCLRSQKPWKKKKTSTEHRSLIIVQEKLSTAPSVGSVIVCCSSGIEATIDRQCQGVIWHPLLSASDAHDSLQELWKSKSKMGIWRIDYQVACKGIFNTTECLAPALAPLAQLNLWKLGKGRLQNKLGKSGKALWTFLSWVSQDNINYSK